MVCRPGSRRWPGEISCSGIEGRTQTAGTAMAAGAHVGPRDSTRRADCPARGQQPRTSLGSLCGASSSCDPTFLIPRRCRCLHVLSTRNVWLSHGGLPISRVVHAGVLLAEVLFRFDDNGEVAPIYVDCRWCLAQCRRTAQGCHHAVRLLQQPVEPRIVGYVQEFGPDASVGGRFKSNMIAHRRGPFTELLSGSG